MQNPPALRFGGRTAVVSGGSRNIGLAISEKLLSVGMNVAIICKSEESRLEASRTLECFDGKFQIWVSDLVKIGNIQPTIDSIYDRFGSIDVLVNCAGILEKEEVVDVTEEIWDQTIDSNLKSIFFLTQKSLPYLKAASEPRIINISSNAGRMGGFLSGSAYAASKGGVISLTFSLARKLGQFGITVNCIAPGTINSDMGNRVIADSGGFLKDRFPLGRLGNPSEVAAAVCYFASMEAAFTTGAVLDVNGGMFMG